MFIFTEGITDKNETTFPDNGQTVDRIACSADLDGDCCSARIEIKIKNCGTYLVYYLNSTAFCPSAYCFGLFRIKCLLIH